MADTDPTSREGIHAIGLMFTQLRWVFREQPTSDYGIDAQAEKLNDQGGATGKLIALQIKSGSSYFRKRRDGYVFYGEQRHRDYWLNHSLPVFIILYDPATNLALWQRIEKELVEDLAEGRWAIQIPADQTLDEKNAALIERGIAGDLASIRRFQLALDKPLIEQFATQEDIILKIEDWVNKSLNFRQTYVLFSDDTAAEPTMELGTWLSAYSIQRFMARHFPWLDWEEVDYEDESNGGGEVAIHVLSVKVNDVGRAMLILDNFYQSELPEDPSPTSPDFDWNELAVYDDVGDE